MTLPLIRIERASLAHIPGLRDLAEATLRAEERYSEAQIERLLKNLYSEANLKRSIENTGVTLLVACHEMALMGMCLFGSPLLEECADRKEIHRLMIHPQYAQDESIGESLLAEVVAVLKGDEAVKRVFVYVSQADEARQQFYIDAGFSHEATEDRDDDLYFVRAL